MWGASPLSVLPFPDALYVLSLSLPWDRLRLQPYLPVPFFKMGLWGRKSALVFACLLGSGWCENLTYTFSFPHHIDSVLPPFLPWEAAETLVDWVSHS